jgi:hypothetical protein
LVAGSQQLASAVPPQHAEAPGFWARMIAALACS